MLTRGRNIALGYAAATRFVNSADFFGLKTTVMPLSLVREIWPETISNGVKSETMLATMFMRE
jgi:hypothetical protein